MRIVTNPGANLTAKQIARYDVRLMPLIVTVDGKHYDLRETGSFDDIDRWIRTARTHPETLGTSAGDFVAVFRELAQQGAKEILCLSGSRKIVGSYKAAVSAARTIMAQREFEKNVRVEVIDSASTDTALGLCCVLAGESARAGRTFGQTIEVVERFASQGAFAFIPYSLEHLVKGGRASFLRAWLADVFKVSPIIGFRDGELTALGRVQRSADFASALADHFTQVLGKGRAVWAVVMHARAPDEGARLTEKIRERFAVVHLEERPFAASSYIQSGQVVGAAINPIDQLPWSPPILPRA